MFYGNALALQDSNGKNENELELATINYVLGVYATVSITVQLDFSTLYSTLY